ncbi:MAG: 50S ribosomal protein L3 [Thaumarchaeota archaeon]|jgi:large subunit ribosomal protein L3|nr:50S ribosomal protein L3 [Candidatus Geocrenenecus arthurdayi]MCL7391648.1 50S ribosomal protein L3 [Candidatus Geocrenenecus arthurdayi]
MGHRKQSAPRRSSLAYLPRGRASRIIPRVKYWPPYDGEPRLLGFIGYKAGHTTIYYIDNTPSSPTLGLEVAKVGTVIATPPVIIAGIVGYTEENGALKEYTRVWASNIPGEIKRNIPTWRPNEKEKLEKLKNSIDKLREVRVIALARPKLAGLPKKKVDLIEIKVGGPIDKALEYAINKLGKEVRISEVFNNGEYVDVIAVSRGKGFEGVVGRHKVKIQPRKKRKTRREVGAIGGRSPAYVTYTVPRAGQLGYHRRTEFNKRILLMAENGLEYTPKGGFPHFGVVKTEAIVVEGTVPGVPKRAIVLRAPARPPRLHEAPQIIMVGVPR